MRRILTILLSSAIICGLIALPVSAQSSDYEENKLLEYAKMYLSVLYENNATGEHTYNDVRFLLADVSGDNKPELFAVGVLDNEMRYLEIYHYNNGNVIKILDDYFGYFHGGAMNLAWYDGGVRVSYGSSSSATGFSDRLIKYENGEWVDIYSSHIEWDWDNSGNIKGYVVNGKYVSEEEFDKARENVGKAVELSDFSNIDNILNNHNEKITVTLNNANIKFDQPPIIVNDRTMVPLRAIFEALGATVDWDGNIQTVTAKKDGITITLKIGDYYFHKNSQKIDIDVPGMIVNDRTLVPVRAISEALDCNVEWDENTQTVKIEKYQNDTDHLYKDEILLDFLNNDFENLNIPAQGENYYTIEEDNTTATYKQKIFAYYLVDLDYDGDNELVVTSQPIVDPNEYYGRLFSVWDCNDYGEINYTLAKYGNNSRAAYRYFIVNWNDHMYLLETTGDGNSGGEMHARNIYQYEDGKFTKEYSIYSYTFDSQNIFEINGETVSSEYLDQNLKKFDSEVEFLFSQMQENSNY